MKKIVRSSDVATYSFETDRSRAWQFMWDLDDAKIGAGFPSLKSPYTVEVGIKQNSDRETADKLAAGAKCVGYAFKGSETVLT